MACTSDNVDLKRHSSYIPMDHIKNILTVFKWTLLNNQPKIALVLIDELDTYLQIESRLFLLYIYLFLFDDCYWCIYKEVTQSIFKMLVKYTRGWSMQLKLQKIVAIFQKHNSSTKTGTSPISWGRKNEVQYSEIKLHFREPQFWASRFELKSDIGLGGKICMSDAKHWATRASTCQI